MYYLVRRFLYMYPWEWDRTPWWLQKIYREGLQAEIPWATFPQLKETFNPFDPKYGVFQDDDLNGQKTYEASLTGLAEMGFNITPAS